MEDLRTLLDDASLDRLREGYDPTALLRANVVATEQVYPPAGPWCAGIASSFFGPDTPLKPVDRERCLVGLLAYTGPDISLSVHIYWGLMEGLSLAEASQTVALTGCYGGLPKAYQGFAVIARTAMLLKRAASASSPGSLEILELLVKEFMPGADIRP